MERLLVLGAGTAGTMVANKLRPRLPRDEWAITLVDQDREHHYQPGYLFIPFGRTLAGATALRDRLASWPGGRLVIHICEMPIKCPAAPLEFAFLAEAFLRERGMRDQVEIVYVTPLDGAFTEPIASARLTRLLEDRKIAVETDFMIERVDTESSSIVSPLPAAMSMRGKHVPHEREE